MKKKTIPLVIIAISLLLMLGNLVSAEKIDIGFYLRIFSSILLILAMVFSIRYQKK